MIVVIMLTYTVSLALQLPPSVTIHNQCPNIELVAPIYFGNGAVCPRLSGQQIDIGTAIKIRFEINPIQDEFEGALLYKLQRRPDRNGTNTFTEANEKTHVHMLVAWRVRHSKPFVYVVLIKYTKEFIWNEDRLRKLYSKNHNRLKKQVGTTLDTWLIDDNITLKTAFRVKNLKECFELDISISEKERDDDAMRPLYVNLKR
jgi:hypothetical protein